MKTQTLVPIFPDNDEDDIPCAECNWGFPKVYVAISLGQDAQQFYQQNGGLCPECLLDYLVKTGARFVVSGTRVTKTR